MPERTHTTWQDHAIRGLLATGAAVGVATVVAGPLAALGLTKAAVAVTFGSSFVTTLVLAWRELRD